MGSEMCIRDRYREVRARDSRTGAVTGIYRQPDLQTCYYSNVPPGSPGRYLSVTRNDPSLDGIARWIRKDFSLGKAIWISGPVGNQTWTVGTGAFMDVDPTGQWVAWYMNVEPGNRGGLAIKSVSDSASVPPTLLNIGGHPSWIDDRHILLNGRIIDRSGKEIRNSGSPSNGPYSLRRYYRY